MCKLRNPVRCQNFKWIFVIYGEMHSCQQRCLCSRRQHHEQHGLQCERFFLRKLKSFKEHLDTKGVFDYSISYLVLDGVSPEDPLQLVMKIHSYSHSSVLRVSQDTRAVTMDISNQQVSAIRKE